MPEGGGRAECHRAAVALIAVLSIVASISRMAPHGGLFRAQQPSSSGEIVGGAVSMG